MTYATRHIETQDDVGCYLERQFLKVNLYFKHVQHQMCALKSNVIFSFSILVYSLCIVLIKEVKDFFNSLWVKKIVLMFHFEPKGQPKYIAELF